jgi:hypothetical protein
MTDSLPPRPTVSADSGGEFPTVAELCDLGATIARVGFAPHEHRLSMVVELARRTGRAPASLDVIIDRSAPEPVRARAFSVLTAAWPDILHRLRATPEYQAFDEAFAELLEAWNERHRLRAHDAPLPDRVAALEVLDRHRLQAARRRRRLTATVIAPDAGAACA